MKSERVSSVTYHHLLPLPRPLAVPRYGRTIINTNTKTTVVRVELISPSVDCGREDSSCFKQIVTGSQTKHFVKETKAEM